MELNKEIIEILDSHGFSFDSIEEQDNEYYIEMNNGTPAGEDWWTTIWFDGTNAGFIDSLEEVVNDFDVNEEVEIWIPGRGQNGVPNSIEVLLEDAKWKLKQLEELLIDLKGVVILWDGLHIMQNSIKIELLIVKKKWINFGLRKKVKNIQS